ncbi:T9SS type A sorting domain-containing protein [Hymenobacter mucosus]|uniref:Por secretion system C-terminal sorting domain-containing protein n=1 Tax=Hymenobacter mucosus TaxID=1411120 RepID=A0A238ZQF3_9BACT|nr:T9SS type A sorting domain-containing protein [Hymenobacter mucosus]SNR84893.1 Por secretion system C-terminal sorting domain-containing protein [Hymenobacter mucosus]
MLNLYTKAATTWRQLALGALVSLGATTAQAQVWSDMRPYTRTIPTRVTPVQQRGNTANRVNDLPYLQTFSQNVSGTYTDLGTSGTAITTANTDDANSAAQPIGFSFVFNGTVYTQFVLNTNGFIKLGSAAPASATDLFPLFNEDDQNIIAATSGIDLTGAADQTATPTEYRVATTGTAGNRICTIQFENLRDKPTTRTTSTVPSQMNTMQFQIRLFEGTNTIELVYGTWTSSGNTPTAQSFYIGLKGLSADPVDLNLTYKAPNQPWNTTIFENTITQNGTVFYLPHLVQNTHLPDAGRTYRFALPDNDVSVDAVYTLGEAPRAFATPHVPQAVISNAGNATLTNIPVTLAVRGPNTFTATQTVASLAPGATTTVTFAGYALTSTGTNTLTVTVPEDDVTLNNSATYTQVVTSNHLSYIDTTEAFAGGVGGTGVDGMLAVKYTLTQPTTLYEVRPTFAGGTSTNTAPYQVVVLDATGANGTPGAVLYTSPTQNRTTAGGTATVAIPNIAVSGSFFVAVKETSASNIGLAVQIEDPQRPNTFFAKLSTGAWIPLNTSNLNFVRLAIAASVGTPQTCQTPTATAVTSTNTTTAAVSFTAPTGATGYTILYGPGGFNPATSGTSVVVTGSPATITGLTSATVYQFYIRTNCSATSQSDLAGPFTFTTQCQPSIVTSFPYSENFDGVASGSIPCGYTVLNVNNDEETWQNRSSVPTDTGPIFVGSSSPNAMTYLYNEDGTTEADDWFFTPALFLRAGSRYQLAFKYRNSGANYPEKLEVKYGTAATVAGQTNTLWNNSNIATATVLTADANSATPVAAITPATTGNYFLGFHVYSAADQFFLAVDDITITSVSTGVSDALVQAVTVYPNPSAGQFTVDIRGANARAGLQVEVTNLVGQRVYTANVRDNFANKLDLSRLASGMYILKVKSGNDYMIRNIAVQK